MYKPKVGDTILLRNIGGAPYIAEVKSIHQRPRGPPQLQVLWIYRPEECPYGRQSGKADQNDEAQFFSRFLLKAAVQRFVPDRVPVLCSCCLPLNPDIWMLECTACGEWYHPDCIGLSEEAARRLVGQFCCDCQNK